MCVSVLSRVDDLLFWNIVYNDNRIHNTVNTSLVNSIMIWNGYDEQTFIQICEDWKKQQQQCQKFILMLN